MFLRHKGQDASLKRAETGLFFTALVAGGFAEHQPCSLGEQRLCLAVTSALGCNQGLTLPDWFFLFCFIIKANFEIPALLIYVLPTVFISVVDSSTTNLKKILA